MPEGINVNKTDGDVVPHYWYFLNLNFKFHLEVSNGCHDLMQKPMNFMMLLVLLSTGMIMKLNFLYRREDEAKNLLRDANLKETIGTL